MADWQQKLYDIVPWPFKQWLVFAEGIRRNYYQRFGDYEAVKQEYDFSNHFRLNKEEIQLRQWEKLSSILKSAKTSSPFYRERLHDISSLNEIITLPVLTKADIRSQLDNIIPTNYPRRHLFKTTTSGSTGTPLKIYIPREALRARYAVMDTYFATYGCAPNSRRVRLGGVRIKPADSTTPPFWIYNRVYNQLQMSAYHLDDTNFSLYRDKINEFQPVCITGYAHTLFRMAQYLNMYGGLTVQPEVIFTDSEGIFPEQRVTIEKAFGAPCYSTYGLREISPVALHCSEHNYHITELSCIVEILDDDNQPLPEGKIGRIVVTDLLQKDFPYIRYDTGDLGSIATDTCNCGNHATVLESIEGKSDDVIITPKGRKVGRVANIIKPINGILESQIAQIARDKIVIRVVPTKQFDPSSMNEAIQAAHALLGSDMRVEWQVVRAIPRTNRHKFKHVVREFIL